MKEITLKVNGQTISGSVDDSTRLLDFVRDSLQLTGTKEGCAVGECGACTILVNGELRLACLMLAAQVDGQQVMTVEGLKASESGIRLQRAFAEAGAVQCGYCTPGMEMTAFNLLARQAHPSREEIRVALSGNLCRCTGYVKIVDAVQQAAAGDHEKTQRLPTKSCGSSL